MKLVLQRTHRVNGHTTVPQIGHTLVPHWTFIKTLKMKVRHEKSPCFKIRWLQIPSVIVSKSPNLFYNSNRGRVDWILFVINRIVSNISNFFYVIIKNTSHLLTLCCSNRIISICRPFGRAVFCGLARQLREVWCRLRISLFERGAALSGARINLQPWGIRSTRSRTKRDGGRAPPRSVVCVSW